MAIYTILFFLGFMLAIGLLAYCSVQVTELNKKAEAFGKMLEERYSKPLTGDDIENKAKANEEPKAEKEELKAEDKK